MEVVRARAAAEERRRLAVASAEAEAARDEARRERGGEATPPAEDAGPSEEGSEAASESARAQPPAGRDSEEDSIALLSREREAIGGFAEELTVAFDRLVGRLESLRESRGHAALARSMPEGRRLDAIATSDKLQILLRLACTTRNRWSEAAWAHEGPG